MPPGASRSKKSPLGAISTNAYVNVSLCFLRCQMHCYILHYTRGTFVRIQQIKVVKLHCCIYLLQGQLTNQQLAVMQKIVLKIQ